MLVRFTIEPTEDCPQVLLNASNLDEEVSCYQEALLRAHHICHNGIYARFCQSLTLESLPEGIPVTFTPKSRCEEFKDPLNEMSDEEIAGMIGELVRGDIFMAIVIKCSQRDMPLEQLNHLLGTNGLPFCDAERYEETKRDFSDVEL